jgi:hypothetical protein
MRALVFVIFSLALACAACHASETEDRPAQVLFVGNSLTYVGNLPAVFSALAGSNGRQIRTDMIVRGGATLSQRVADGSVARALNEKPYMAVVLQERGGDLMGLFGDDADAQSRRAVADLAKLGHEKGVKVVLLGSYQPHRAASEHLLHGESAAAQAAGVPYIAVSDVLQKALGEAPELTWFAPDGAHPGTDLALLNGLLVYKTLFGSLPEPVALHVNAPIYGTTSGLKETLRPSDAAPPLPGTPVGIRYHPETMRKLIGAISSASATSPGF